MQVYSTVLVLSLGGRGFVVNNEQK